ncbi:MAG: PfkB family carbohydrate kinase [Cyanobacteriota bacterium]|nr:PfkB family carbohydrate kinase [Cyanobacteriota bacterium]
MRLWPLEELPKLPPLRLAVVGHVEWVDLLAVERLPQAGRVGHALAFLEEAAGGGAVVAVTLARLLQQPVTFFTALGRDATGERAAERLRALGLHLEVAWREAATRRAVSFVDDQGDRAITVIGPRLSPTAADLLPWASLADVDGVFVTAADAAALRACRASRLLLATPRVGLPLLREAGVALDALIGSGLDPAEAVPPGAVHPQPVLSIATEGAAGGVAHPGGRFPAPSLQGPLVDAYGCGDSFAAGVMAGLAAHWTVEQAISLGCHLGAACALHLGPYAPAATDMDPGVQPSG